MAVSEGAKPAKEPKARKAKAKSEKAAEAPAPEQPAGAVTALDFSQPTKFTAELRHRIAAALEPFCESLAATLTSECKREVQIAITEVSQHTWAALRSRLEADSMAVAVEERAISRQMLMSVELALVLQALECLLGGEPTEASTARHLSEVDWALARELLDGIVTELSQAWTDLGGPELARGEVDVEGDAGVLTPAGEATLLVTFKSDIGGAVAGFSLLIPWAAVAPIADTIRGGASAAPHGEHTVEGADALRRGVSGAHVLLRAEVGAVQMPVRGMLELLPGELVTLADRESDGVRVYAEGVAVARGRPGRSGTRRAIKLESTTEPPVRADTFATLGRAELERARAHVAGAPDGAVGGILEAIFVRVWAELGRTHMGLGRALELTPGLVVELDQDAQAPVELFANGLCFASGSLVVTEDGSWGVRVERLV